MKIQPIPAQAKSTNFKAKTVTQVVTRFANGKTDIVDIYRLSPKDRPFIERCLLVLQGKDRQIANDSQGVCTKNPKADLKNFFKDIISSGLSPYTDSFIAIKNNEQIEGVASILHVGNYSFFNHLIGINDLKDANTRRGLISSCLKSAPKGNNFIIPKSLRQPETAKFFRDLEFTIPKYSGGILASKEPNFSIRLANTAINPSHKIKTKIVNVNDKTEKDLQKVLKLDEQ